MNYKLLLISIIFFCAIVKNASSNCNCGAPSVDLCKCRNSIVRPVPAAPSIFLPRKICKTITVPTLKPIGDRCNCRRNVVKPEIRKCPTCCQAPCSCEEVEVVEVPEPKTCPKCCTKPTTKSPCVVVSDECDEENSLNSLGAGAPADPLSIILANNQAARLRNREGNLFHGFHMDPRLTLNELNDPVSEEKLFDQDGNVLELINNSDDSSNECGCQVVKSTCPTPTPEPCTVCRKTTCTCKTQTQPCNSCQKKKCTCTKPKTPAPCISEESESESSEEDCETPPRPTTAPPTLPTLSCPCKTKRPAGNTQDNLEKLLRAIGFK